MHQQPDWECKYGHSSIVKDRLFLAGEDDVDELLYGEEESRNINRTLAFQSVPNPAVDVWIDLRDKRKSNRIVLLPEAVEYLEFPFRDGEMEEARRVLPSALEALNQAQLAGKRVMVTCHQGRSRSFALVLWYLCEAWGCYDDAFWHIKRCRPIVEADKNFKPLLAEWRKTYHKELLS